MDILINLAQLINTIGSNYILLAIVFTVSVILKLFFLYPVVTTRTIGAIGKINKILLICLLICTIQQDSVWLMHVSFRLFAPIILSSPFYMFYIRFSWGFFVVQYQIIALFIQSLVGINPLADFKQKILLFFSALIFTAQTYMAFILSSELENSFNEIIIRSIFWTYALAPVIIFALVVTYYQYKKNNIPVIIKQQLAILIFRMIGPYWILDILQIYPLSLSTDWIVSSYTFLSISNIILCVAIFYCARKIMRLRFLNIHNHVKSHPRFNFMDDFKMILEQFSTVTTLEQLGNITQSFFSDSFHIPLSKIHLFIKTAREEQEAKKSIVSQSIVTVIEDFINYYPDISEVILKQKILIYDETDFSNFYEKTTTRENILSFLNAINADIFLAVYDNEKIVAYIVVERLARREKLYSDVERDEMLIFGSYLGNIINLIKNKSLDMLIHQAKQLKEELYQERRLLSQFKESVRSFVRTSKQRSIGIIFYRSNKFIFGNHTAQEMIQINPNYQAGHPITKILKTIVHNVELFKTQQTLFAKDNNNCPLIIAGAPQLEQRHTILMLYYPEMSDIIKHRIDYLKNPAEWDYLLYLETTESGKLINQLIPSSSELMLAFKIDLLKASLSYKHILLDIPEEDVRSIVDIMHHISLRETLYVIELHNTDTNNEVGIKLFGINPLLVRWEAQETPLLEKLKQNSTICIKNVHFLHPDAQEQLAEFLRCGYFRRLKSDCRITSEARIICSTNRTFSSLAQPESEFNRQLLEELKHTLISLPPLSALPEEEVSYLAQALGEQSLQDKTLKKLLEITPREARRLAHTRPISLRELRDKVYRAVHNKSKRNDMFDETQFNPAYDITDPELMEAARLGKHALKDPKILTFLWNKFKNQNQIATFLGVNRSSVNRRCREFNLQ